MEIPGEEGAPGMCGLLNKSMYRTRDAACNRESDDMKCVESTAFEAWTSTPYAFYQRDRNMRLVVHGNVFSLLGHRGPRVNGVVHKRKR